MLGFTFDSTLQHAIYVCCVDSIRGYQITKLTLKVDRKMKLTDYRKKIKESLTTPPTTGVRLMIQSLEIKMNQYFNKCEY